MILYDYAAAPSPRRARIFIAEKGIEVEKRPVDLAAQEQLSAEFRAINPACTVPVLVLEDGTALTENGAIAAYLEARFPEPPLLGSSPEEKGLIANWNDRCVLEGFAAVAESFRNHSRGFKNRAVTGPADHPQVPELVARGRQRAEAFFDVLDGRLAASGWLGGDAFSIADITALCLVDFARWIKLEVGERPHLARWYEQASQRPSASA